jgi:hypothetical protein
MSPTSAAAAPAWLAALSPLNPQFDGIFTSGSQTVARFSLLISH